MFNRLFQKVKSLFTQEINEETLEELEKTLYEADLGVQTAVALTDSVRKAHRKNPDASADTLIATIREEITSLLSEHSTELVEVAALPLVILIVGVNGNGKTTSVAKLAHHLKNRGKKVLIAAADTFRAAAMEQLETWADRLQVDIVRGKPQQDPASIAFDALKKGKEEKADVVIIDTAGRLHTRNDLMVELGKISRACEKAHPKSPHETLLVLDATIGQNGVDQARIFHEHTPISGLILTKLDGTAKGGTVVNIQRQLDIPVKFVGLGEQIEDLEEFNPQNFASSLFD